MAIIWPCALSVDQYVACGRELEVPRPTCPACTGSMTLWSGYMRSVRTDGRCVRVWVPRLRCRGCDTTHALLPAFVVVRRLDTVETIGAVLDGVVDGPHGARPVARRLDVPHTTVRGWLKRLRERAERLAVAFAALAVELGGEIPGAVADVTRQALAAMTAASDAAFALPGWQVIGRWRFVSCVSGGRLLATNTDSPYLVVGRRRFMPPVP